VSSDPARTAADPVCPRHPDRVSYVRCQRCERPVCPECQRPAAVGVQCVDCVKEGGRQVRTGRTVFGGAVARDGRPLVTQVIIAVCVVVYVLQRANDDVTLRFLYAPVTTVAEPWRMITVAFLHSPGQLFHIIFNMLALWLTGPYLESLFGRVRFLALYFLSAFGGSVALLLLANPNDASEWQGGAVGASGAVFGLFAALFVVSRKLGLETAGIAVMIGINAVIGFIPGYNISWEGHLGGLVTGFLVGVVLAYAPKERRTLYQVTGCVAILVVLLALVAVKVAMYPDYFPSSLGG
jgi:membrane associated rhomboid family serine protease